MRNPWVALVALSMPVLIISMDNTVLAFAVPQLSESIGPSSSQLLWIVDAYSFVLAGLLVTMGNLGDRIGRRRLLMWGSAGFALTSVAAAFSTTAPMLITSRALLGVAGATLLPSTMSIIRNIFTDDHQRMTAIAVWTTMFALGGALGPILGGFLLQHFWFGSVFLTALPVTLALLVVGPLLLPESKDPEPGPFDIRSSVLSFIAIVPVIYGVKIVAEHGLGADAILAVAIGITAGTVFVRRQRKLDSPMIDVALFRLPRFRTAIIASLVGCFAYSGSLFMVTQYLQLVSGQSPIEAAVMLLPAAAAAVVCTLSAPLLARRFGAFTVIGVAMACISAGFVGLATLSVGGSTITVVIALTIMNGGFGASSAVAIDAILSSVPAERAGAGAAVSETCAELGIALGTALLGSAVVFVYRRQLTQVDGVDQASVDSARETLGAATLTARDLGGPAGDALRTAADTAFTNGIRVASVFALTIALATAVMTLRGRRLTA